MARKAFTIVELLIVILIVATIVGIGLPRLRGMLMDADIAKAEGELRSLQTAVESYFIHNGALPSQERTPSTAWQVVLTSATPKFILDELEDPFAPGETYRWATSQRRNAEYYVIFSVGPNRVAEITGIRRNGNLRGAVGDDIYITNGPA